MGWSAPPSEATRVGVPRFRLCLKAPDGLEEVPTGYEALPDLSLEELEGLEEVAFSESVRAPGLDDETGKELGAAPGAPDPAEVSTGRVRISGVVRTTSRPGPGQNGSGIATA